MFSSTLDWKTFQLCSRLSWRYPTEQKLRCTTQRINIWKTFKKRCPQNPPLWSVTNTAAKLCLSPIACARNLWSLDSNRICIFSTTASHPQLHMPDKRCIYCQYAIPRALKSDALMLLMIWGMPWDWSVPDQGAPERSMQLPIRTAAKKNAPSRLTFGFYY